MAAQAQPVDDSVEKLEQLVAKLSATSEGVHEDATALGELANALEEEEGDTNTTLEAVSEALEGEESELDAAWDQARTSVMHLVDEAYDAAQEVLPAAEVRMESALQEIAQRVGQETAELQEAVTSTLQSGFEPLAQGMDVIEGNLTGEASELERTSLELEQVLVKLDEDVESQSTETVTALTPRGPSWRPR